MFSFVSLAQEKNLAIEISLKNSTILTTDKNVPVKIKITNKSAQTLKTEDLGNLFLYFSKCRKDEMCYRKDDLLSASVGIKAKILKKNKSIEFESNLSDFVWSDNLSSAHIDGNNPENLLDYEKRVDALTLKDLQNAAKKFLDMNNYVRAVLYPENATVPGGIQKTF